MAAKRCVYDLKEKTTQSVYSLEDVPDISLPSLLYQKLQQDPNREALIDCPSGRLWTALELEEAVTRVARGFVDLGLKRGEVVSFYCPNSDYHVIGQLAVMAAGGVYTGCYSTHPFREVYNNVVGSDAVYLVASKSNVTVAEKVASDVKDIRKLIIIDEAIEKTGVGYPHGVSFHRLMNSDVNADLAIPVPVGPNDTAALLFSSGTTGKPKGVIMTHKNIVSYCKQKNHPSVSFYRKEDVALVHQPLPHAGGLLFVISYLNSGTKFLVNPGFEITNFLSIVEKYSVSVVLLIPSYIVLLTKSQLLSKYKINCIKHIYTGGAPLPDSIVTEAIEKLHLKNISQVYGSTEAGMVTSCPRDVFNPKTIGIPVPGVTVKIVDPNSGQALGPNAVGEIYVKGLQVTPAYYKNPEATAAAFTEDGFFKTGDACYYDEDGFFFIVDRYKEVIKVDTQQVAPAEVESVLLCHEAVAEAAVVGIPHEVHGEVPKAYVVVKEGHTVTASALIDYVSGQVATWKQLKGGLEFKEVLPKLGFGKIDRKQLKLLATEK